MTDTRLLDFVYKSMRAIQATQKEAKRMADALERMADAQEALLQLERDRDDFRSYRTPSRS